MSETEQKCKVYKYDLMKKLIDEFENDKRIANEYATPENLEYIQNNLQEKTAKLNEELLKITMTDFTSELAECSNYSD